MQSVLSVEVSCFANYNIAINPQPVNLLHWLTSKKYSKEVEAIRNYQDKAIRDAAKANLPAITPSGLFSYRCEKNLLRHSRLIQFDIDAKENRHIGNYGDLKKHICNIIHVAYCGVSVSGTGYWGLIPIAYPDRHTEHFIFIEKQFLEAGIIIDDKPKNIASLRGYSYDPDGYFNHNAVVLQSYYKPTPLPPHRRKYYIGGNDTQADIEAIINRIINTGVDITNGYDNWRNIGFALADEFGEAGRQYFHNISQYNSGYNYQQTDRQFTKCLQAKGVGITIKSFYHICKEAGIAIKKPSNKKEDDSGNNIAAFADEPHSAALKAFDKWFALHPEGGIFQYENNRFLITRKNKQPAA